MVNEKVTLPEGVHVEWSGQFEHQIRAVHTPHAPKARESPEPDHRHAIRGRDERPIQDLSQRGVSLGHGHIAIDGGVLSLTPVGAPVRMPNGIEADLDLAHGERVHIGDGLLATPDRSVPGAAGASRTGAGVRLSVTAISRPPP